MSLQDARNLRKMGKFKEALALLEPYLATLREDQRFKRIDGLNEQTQCYWRSGCFKKALATAQHAFQLAKKNPVYLQGQADAQRNLGAIYWFQGDLALAEGFWKKSLLLAEELGNPLDVAGSLLNLGNVYWKQGKLEQAKRHYKQSLKKNQEAGNALEVARSMHNVGLIYTQQGNLIEAERYIEQSVATYQQEGSSDNMAHPLTTLGRIYLERGNSKQAQKYLEQSLALNEEMNNPLYIATSLSQLIIALLAHESINSAIKHIYDLNKLSEETGIVEIAIMHSLALARYEIHEKELASAIEGVRQALERFDTAKIFDLQIEAKQLLVQALLEHYLLVKKPADREAVEDLIVDLENLSKQEQLHGTYIKTVLVKGHLKQIAYDLTGAIADFELAHLLAVEGGFLSLAQKAETELAVLREQRPFVEKSYEDSPVAYENENLGQLIGFLRSLRTPVTFDNDNFFMFGIKFTERGPAVFCSHKIPFQDQQGRSILSKAGIFYTTAVGQGTAHHQGFYGPLPLTENYSCLIYACHLSDATMHDPRLSGKTYCLICLGYPNEFSRFFVNRATLSATFEEQIREVNDVSEIGQSFLDRLRRDLLANSFLRFGES
ncbi:MAG: tetratricopeptide repeat protein [Candidatus Hodarchaeales archaeon]